MLLPARPGRRALLWWLRADDAAFSVVISPAPPAPSRITAPRVGRDVHVVAVTGLEPDTAYELAVDFGDGRRLRSRSRTLPEALSAGAPFTISVGSCYAGRDAGRLATLFPPPRHAGDDDPIRLRASLGDQVYMDVPIRRLAPDVWHRYEAQWSSASWTDFLRDAPNVFMPDDHEFWNNFPHGAPHLLWTPAAGPALRDFMGAYDLFQGASNLDPEAVAAPRNASPRALALLLAARTRSFALPDAPLPMYFLDVRSHRGLCDRDGAPLASARDLVDARDWLHALGAPGVLFLSQPLVPTGESLLGSLMRNSIDCFPIHYRDDFALLCDAVFSAPHDVLVITGDIHFDRLLRLERARAGGTRTVYELSASPYSLVAGDSVDPDDVRRPEGELAWASPDGAARWTRLYGRAAPLSYTTVTFRTGDAGSVRVEARVWGEPAGAEGVGPALAESHAFTLT